MRIKPGILFLSLLLAACATGRPNLPELPAGSGPLAIDGASFAPPAEKGWYFVLRSPYHLGLATLGDSPDESIAIEARLYKVPPPVAGKDFAEQIKEGEDQDTDPKRFTTKLHEVTAADIGTATCARSHFVTEDNAPHTASGHKGTMILEALSLNCIHPDDPKVGVNVVYSDRHYPGHEDPEFMRKAAAILDSVQLTKLQE